MNHYLLCLLLFFSCSFSTKRSQESTAQSLATTHFLLQWTAGETTREEIDEAVIFCEEIYSKMASVLGEERMPDHRINVIFGGEGLRPGQPKRTPNVDYRGQIRLYRFSQGGYLDPFPHELVHAIRANRVAQWERFFEEGFASAIAATIYPEKTGFPLFGYERSKIMAYLMSQDYFITLSEMKARHRELNLRCQLQTYIPREDFFYYLKETYGMDKLLAFAHSGRTSETVLYEEIWGKSFTDLEADWTAYVSNLHDPQEVKRTGEEYFEKTSARYIPVCK